MSKVWRHYVKKGTFGVCNKCEKQISCKDGSTTGMSRHLKRIHQIDVEQEEVTDSNDTKKKRCVEGVSQPTIKNFMAKKANYNKEDPKYQRLVYHVAKTMFKDLQPLSVVDDEGFIELLNEMDPRFVVPSRNTFKCTVLPSLHANCAGKLRQDIAAYKELFGINSLYGITTDAWTSNSNTSYVTYTLHLVKDFNINSYNLATVELAERHTADNLLSHILKTLQCWNILPGRDNSEDTSTMDAASGSDQMDIETDDDHNQDCEIPTYVQRTVAVTHDNASNITKALHNSSLQSIRCFAHTLNLSVQKFSRAINEHISHMREVVKYIHKSPAATKLVEQSNEKGLRVIIDVSTRWNSTYDMVVRYIKIDTAVYTTLSQLKANDQLRHHGKLDLDLLGRFIEVLKPFKDITTMLSSQTNVTVSLVKPLLRKLLVASKPTAGEPAALHQAKAALYHDLEARWKINDTALLDACSFSDPRTKDLTHISQEQRDKTYNAVMSSLQVDAQPLTPVRVEPESDNTESEQCLLSSLLPEFNPVTAADGDAMDVASLELATYKRMKGCSMQDNPLDW